MWRRTPTGSTLSKMLVAQVIQGAGVPEELQRVSSRIWRCRTQVPYQRPGSTIVFQCTSQPRTISTRFAEDSAAKCAKSTRDCARRYPRDISHPPPSRRDQESIRLLEEGTYHLQKGIRSVAIDHAVGSTQDEDWILSTNPLVPDQPT